MSVEASTVLHLHPSNLNRKDDATTICTTRKKDQINIIKQTGAFLFIRREAGVDIILYQIDGFYAEVFFDSAIDHSARIRSFDDMGSLDIYLKKINLSEIRGLLD